MDILTGVADLLADLPPAAIYLVAAVLLAAEVGVLAGLVVPAASVMLSLGALAQTGRVHLGLAIAVAVTSALAGDSIGYWEGRLLGRRVRTGRIGRRIGARRWQRAESAVRRSGGPAVLLGRWIAYLRTLVPRLAGAGGMAYRRFLPFNAAAVLVWVPGTVLVGYLAGGALPWS
jgi:membrane protein DedA with SNARE-associated domain